MSQISEIWVEEKLIILFEIHDVTDGVSYIKAQKFECPTVSFYAKEWMDK